MSLLSTQELLHLGIVILAKSQISNLVSINITFIKLVVWRSFVVFRQPTMKDTCRLKLYSRACLSHLACRRFRRADKWKKARSIDTAELISPYSSNIVAAITNAVGRIFALGVEFADGSTDLDSVLVYVYLRNDVSDGLLLRVSISILSELLV
ncbi:uncharacterized protein BT62DRAFT_606635 [Guyanagaster necrorhizus]|uniref:Uncharacterized protein n=1 Tax=Guyanagaster necrorhizus TaxID=856835 RepID=A0A9P8AW46_9AGAR|nr:uncharacterized protein BT62DRAFT_606635 [Guyanagaster necrorhizus MCA 3950]KAG7449781.1 hypothetical protein BT62DRAFT_606635 [Guyanagaster necrorhizus MCA 3950]